MLSDSSNPAKNRSEKEEEKLTCVNVNLNANILHQSDQSIDSNDIEECSNKAGNC